MSRTIRTFALSTLVLVALAACNAKTDQSGNGPAQQSDGSSKPAGLEATNPREVPVLQPQHDMPTRGAGAVAEAETKVDLLEYQVNMPKTLKAGPQLFAVANAGKEEHSLVIEGNGVKAGLSEPLKTPGNSSQIKVNLPPGTYTAYCPIPGHKEKGMTTTITVQ